MLKKTALLYIVVSILWALPKGDKDSEFLLHIKKLLQKE